MADKLKRILEENCGVGCTDLQFQDFTEERLKKLGWPEGSRVSRGSVPGIVAASNWPRIDVLQMWLAACGKTFGWLFEETESKYQFKDEHDQLEYVLEKQGKDGDVAKFLTSQYENLTYRARTAARASPRRRRGVTGTAPKGGHGDRKKTA